MFYIIASMVLYSAAIIGSAAASRAINTTIAAAIINLVCAILPIILAIPLLNKDVFVSQKAGIAFAVLSGIFIAIFAIMVNKAYAVNNVGIVAPLVFGGAIALSTVASFFIFKEKIDLLQGIGLVLVVVGLSIVAYARQVAA